jgi:hypothetical protein
VACKVLMHRRPDGTAVMSCDHCMQDPSNCRNCACTCTTYWYTPLFPSLIQSRSECTTAKWRKRVKIAWLPAALLQVEQRLCSKHKVRSLDMYQLLRTCRYTPGLCNAFSSRSTGRCRTEAQ